MDVVLERYQKFQPKAKHRRAEGHLAFSLGWNVSELSIRLWWLYATVHVTMFCLPRRIRSWTSCTLKMLHHVWSHPPENMTVVCLGWCTMTYTNWLFLSECGTSLLWQSIVVFGTELQGISPTTVCQSLKLLVASICDLPDVINCHFREFAVAPLGSVHFCRCTKSLEFTAWSSAGSSCWSRTV